VTILLLTENHAARQTEAAKSILRYTQDIPAHRSFVYSVRRRQRWWVL